MFLNQKKLKYVNTIKTIDIRILRFKDLYKNIIILAQLIISGGLEDKSYIIIFLEGF